VVNREPLRSELLLLTIVTSNIADVRTRNRTRMETVVEITPSEYEDFTRRSAVDCNVVIEKPNSPEWSDGKRSVTIRIFRQTSSQKFAPQFSRVLSLLTS
jgi:hypothetical protein